MRLLEKRVFAAVASRRRGSDHGALAPNAKPHHALEFLFGDPIGPSGLRDQPASVNHDDFPRVERTSFCPSRTCNALVTPERRTPSITDMYLCVMSRTWLFCLSCSMRSQRASRCGIENCALARAV